uniref:Uncharacterized protein n=1 Tax=Xiphophorus couchianus TaxID=32473 RepID=A0A3B5KYF4_9TELE
YREIPSNSRSVCRKFQANFFNKSKCQNCFKPRELHLLTDQDLTQDFSENAPRLPPIPAVCGEPPPPPHKEVSVCLPSGQTSNQLAAWLRNTV